MTDPLNLIEFVRDLGTRPRGRACIVLTQEYHGQKEWAKQLAQQTNSDHLDLLELFTQDLELGNKIGQFMVATLYDFLENYNNHAVLVVSGLEFLTATWTAQPNAMDEFLTQLKTWDKKTCLVFVLQHDKIIESYDFGRRYQHTFVVDQRETLAL
jgi:hypothetical protein